MGMPGGGRCSEEKLSGESSQRATLDTKKGEDVTKEMTFEQKLSGGRELALRTLVVQAEGTGRTKVSEVGMALHVQG